ncbi:MAG: protein translocase subunit SecF [Acidimicrobiales bacterium]|nr:protein translocase subunit SecF [Hyphomonadaceae bacterium]RZV42858.1 MAG: protein translocase subunit SecF [Acidimicrobiales bacterium]
MKDISLIKFIPKDSKIPFISARKIAAVLSILGIIASIFLFTTKNLNYGIDFTGGTVWQFHLEENPTENDLENIRTVANNLDLGGVGLQTITTGEVEGIRLTIPKQVSLEGADSDDSAQQAALTKVREAINAEYPERVENGNPVPGSGVTELSTSVLGTKVSGELKVKGALAVGLALFMVLCYIWVRFEWQFGLGAVVALAHDVTLTIGVFSLTQLEFNLSIVAAILTIVGYSLNDTVIVYDRIRENLRKYKKMPLPDVLNLSINDTLSRTIMTSMTTLLALISLYLWGGPGLNGFAFAMIWGVLVGTYSSIFVASPLLMLLNVNRSGTQK